MIRKSAPRETGAFFIAGPRSGIPGGQSSDHAGILPAMPGLGYHAIWNRLSMEVMK